MIRHRLCLLSFLTLILLAPATATAQQSSSAATSKAEAELRESIRLYDEALRGADVVATYSTISTSNVLYRPICLQPRLLTTPNADAIRRAA